MRRESFKFHESASVSRDPDGREMTYYHDSAARSPGFDNQTMIIVIYDPDEDLYENSLRRFGGVCASRRKLNCQVFGYKRSGE